MSTTATPAATTATPKSPSKKSQADAIFAAKVVDLKAGKFPTNKEFRQAVLTQIQIDLNVSVASAATMFNASKKSTEASDPSVKLGRDPRKEKIKGNGKRGRPVGSGKKKVVQITTVDESATA